VRSEWRAGTDEPGTIVLDLVDLGETGPPSVFAIDCNNLDISFAGVSGRTIEKIAAVLADSPQEVRARGRADGPQRQGGRRLSPCSKSSKRTFTGPAVGAGLEGDCWQGHKPAEGGQERLLVEFSAVVADIDPDPLTLDERRAQASVIPTMLRFRKSAMPPRGVRDGN